MSSRLNEIKDWPGLIRDVGYNVTAAAQKCGVSIRQLQRFLRRATGMSPKKWFNQLRQSRAPSLLESGKSVKEVAYELKYTRSHFSRAYKQFHNKPPTHDKNP